MNMVPPADGAAVADQIDDASFRRLAAIVREESGIVLSEAKRNLAVSRLARRLRQLQLSDFSQYCDLIASETAEEERRTLISLLTTNVTRFFRERHHFDMLERDLLPDLVARARSGGRIRIWSAGCSTGEEPYSIAISLLEAFPDAAKHDVRILGTDIDPRVIGTATAAEYSDVEEAHLPAETRNRHFEVVDPATGRLRVKPEVRRLVTFAELNLLRSWPMKGPFDVIFCRNVVIYFDSETQTMLWKRFADLLAPGGTLFLGHSERADTTRESRLVATGITQYRRSPGRA